MGSGVTRGVKGLASSVADGVSGVVAQPYAGAQSEGVWGFGKLTLPTPLVSSNMYSIIGKGVAKGVLGLGTKVLFLFHSFFGWFQAYSCVFLYSQLLER